MLEEREEPSGGQPYIPVFAASAAAGDSAVPQTFAASAAEPGRSSAVPTAEQWMQEVSGLENESKVEEVLMQAKEEEGEERPAEEATADQPAPEEMADWGGSEQEEEEEEKEEPIEPAASAALPAQPAASAAPSIQPAASAAASPAAPQPPPPQSPTVELFPGIQVAQVADGGHPAWHIHRTFLILGLIDRAIMLNCSSTFCRPSLPSLVR